MECSEKKKPYTCNVCERSFHRKPYLNSHYLTHSREKPHICNICDKSFAQKGHLNRHILCHMEERERPHVCDICNKSFTAKQALERHVLSHSGEKPYVCSLCNKSFHAKENLKIHMFVHTEERPYQCDICKKSFKQKHLLKKHSISHSGERPHVCDVCNKSFTYRSDLKQHSLNHSGKFPHACKICKKSFKRKDRLRKHMDDHVEEEKCNSQAAKASTHPSTSTATILCPTVALMPVPTLTTAYFGMPQQVPQLFFLGTVVGSSPVFNTVYPIQESSEQVPNILQGGYQGTTQMLEKRGDYGSIEKSDENVKGKTTDGQRKIFDIKEKTGKQYQIDEESGIVSLRKEKEVRKPRNKVLKKSEDNDDVCVEVKQEAISEYADVVYCDDLIKKETDIKDVYY